MTAPQPPFSVTPEEVLAQPNAGWLLWRALRAVGMQWPAPEEPADPLVETP